MTVSGDRVFKEVMREAVQMDTLSNLPSGLFVRGHLDPQTDQGAGTEQLKKQNILYSSVYLLELKWSVNF